MRRLMVTGMLVAALGVVSVALASTTPAVDRVSGPSRYETGIAAARMAYPDGCSTVIIATFMAPFETQLAMPLAGALDAAVLGAGTTGLSSSTLAAISSLGATRAVVVGDLGATVDGQLASCGITDVTHVSAPDIEALAACLATATVAAGGAGEAFIVPADSQHWRIALAVAPMSFSRRMPVLLGTPGGLSATCTVAALRSAGTTHCIIVGDFFDIGSVAEQQLDAEGISHERIFVSDVGYGGTGLCLEPASSGVERGWADFTQPGIGTTMHWADSLTAGVLTGRRGGVMLFTTPWSLPNEVEQVLYDHASEVATITIYGGTAAVSISVANDLSVLDPTPSVPGTRVCGTVTDRAGVPAEGVDVMLTMLRSADIGGVTEYHYTTAGHALTDADGRWSIPDAQAGTWWPLFYDRHDRFVQSGYGSGPGFPYCGDPVSVSPGVLVSADASLATLAEWESEIVTRVAGNDRYATAIQVSRVNHRRAPAIVLCSGWGFADALTAAPLTGCYQAPLLLTPRDSLPSGLLDEVDRLGATQVIVVGGPASVGEGVLSALRAHGLTVERISGADRYATSCAVYARLQLLKGSALPASPFLVNGDLFPDALSAGSYAALEGRPVLLTKATSCPWAVRNLWAAQGLESVYVIGGTGAVSDTVLQQLADVSLGGVVYYDRISGADRYATSVALADAYGGGFDFFGLASGASFPDGLAGAALCGARSGALLLVPRDGMTAAQKTLLAVNADWLYQVQVYGGTKAVGSGVLTDARVAAGYGPVGPAAASARTGSGARAAEPKVPRLGGDHQRFESIVR